MPQEKKPRFTLGSADDLFTTQEMRDDAKLARIHEIQLDEIDEFPEHPYKVKDDEDMMNLVESIRENGVLTPATVRKKDDGRYEMLSGHRRHRACQLLGLDTLRCEIVELDRDEATIFMCDSNLQRTVILPSEKAFAYKMRLDAMKRQGKRTDLTSSPLATELGVGRADVELGRAVGEGKDNVRRYIRLTELIPEILDMVDEGQIAMRPAVEISYLPKEFQQELLENMEIEACTPSHDQAMRMKGLFKQGKLTPEVISAIMQEEKPNQREKVILRDERTIKLLPRDLPVSEREEYILKALEHYGRYLRKQRDLER
ncbi:MAG: ParB/RepB/Spo0J family partition protein [Mogibacterium kristiansenii]|uniref:ParB/RepB/Spo0J family partition protein n=1 Tax=Mogibacterium kristiansenii TaxID=2606708 RepID=UPI003F07E479